MFYLNSFCKCFLFFLVLCWAAPSNAFQVLTPAEEFIVDSIDNRLASASDPAVDVGNPMNSLRRFSTLQHLANTAFPDGNYVNNLGSWAADLDLTSIYVWNSRRADHLKGTNGGVLVSPRHLSIAAHYPDELRAGDTVRFVDRDNNVVVREIIAAMDHPMALNTVQHDIRICLLDQDVPSSISFSKILPENWGSAGVKICTRCFPVL